MAAAVVLFHTVRECAIYGLGAISVGCEIALRPHMPKVAEFLFGSLRSAWPHVRNTSCWALARYSGTVLALDSALFLRYLQELVKGIADPDPMVQTTVCESINSLISKVPGKLGLYGKDILGVLISKFEMCKRFVQAQLYYIIGRLFEISYKGKVREDEEFLNTVLSFLSNQWSKLKDDDILLCSLMQCFTTLIPELGLRSEKLASPLLKRAFNILSTLSTSPTPASKTAPTLNTHFAICSLDVVGSLCCALGEGVATHFAGMGELPAGILLTACGSGDAQVLQYACGVLGDGVRSAGKYFEPYVPHIIDILLSSLSFNPKDTCSEYSLCSSITWTLSEIALAYPHVASQFARKCAVHLQRHFRAEKFKGAVAQSAAVVLGRLGMCAPCEVAADIEFVLKDWCLAAKELDGGKEESYRGLCSAVRANLQGAMKDFGYFCDAVVECGKPGKKLEQEFKEILATAKDKMPEQWRDCCSKLPENLKKNLIRIFESQ